jgi:hypothetical protein
MLVEIAAYLVCAWGYLRREIVQLLANQVSILFFLLQTVLNHFSCVANMLGWR